jgi:prepilin-type processing-associated H-X9-DG protein
MTERSRRVGYTLLELVVTVAVGATLLALLLPTVQRARDAAARAGCSSNLRQLAIAIHAYDNVARRLPAGCASPLPGTRRIVDSQPGVSWHTTILPFLESSELGRRAWEANQIDPFHLDVIMQEDIGKNQVSVFLCPAESRRLGDGVTRKWALTSYLGVAGTGFRRMNGVFHPNRNFRLVDITDGTSNTLMVGERPPGPQGIHSGWYSDWTSCVCVVTNIRSANDADWYPTLGDCPFREHNDPLRPGQRDEACDQTHFWSLHVGGAYFAFADGSVKFLSYARSPILPALATRSGGEILSLD